MKESKFDYRRHVEGRWRQMKHRPWTPDGQDAPPKKGNYTFHRLQLVDMDRISNQEPIKATLTGKNAITIKMLHATTEKGVHAILQTGRVKAMPYEGDDNDADRPIVNHTVVYGQGTRVEPGEENKTANGDDLCRIANKASFNSHNLTGIAFEMEASGEHKPIKRGGTDEEQRQIDINNNAVCSMQGRWSVHQNNQTICAIWIISPVMCSHRHSSTKRLRDDIYLY
jgi:hypothetical protein